TAPSRCCRAAAATCAAARSCPPPPAPPPTSPAPASAWPCARPEPRTPLPSGTVTPMLNPSSAAGSVSPLFGKLGWDAIPLHEPILVATFAGVALGGLAMLALLTKFRLWGPLWRDWLTSIDHKKIGIMYMVLGLVMLLRAVAHRVL